MKKTRIGERFWKLQITSKLKIGWLCKCDCGNEKIIRTLNQVISGRLKSCGCHRRENSRKMLLKHGHKCGGIPSPTLTSYRAMLQRCYYQPNKRFERYGGRGIQVCCRWHDKPNGFINFLADMGERPEGMTLDRINNNGHYMPSNCRWTTLSQQRQNRKWKN